MVFAVGQFFLHAVDRLPGDHVHMVPEALARKGRLQQTPQTPDLVEIARYKFVYGVDICLVLEQRNLVLVGTLTIDT